MGNVVRRFVGIDFGTSTSTVFYKDFVDGSDDGLDAHPAMAGDRSTVPTVLFDGGDEQLYGEDALDAVERLLRRDGPSDGWAFHQRWKMDLIPSRHPTPDEEARCERAWDLTERFLGKLREGFLASTTAPIGVEIEEHTRISFPAKWPGEVRRGMIEAARAAGFERVEGVTEPIAAMYFFAVRKDTGYAELEARGIIEQGRPITVLLVDMGAGTTDFVLYQRSVGVDDIRVLYDWPPIDRAEDEGHLGGGDVEMAYFDAHVRPVLDRAPAIAISDAQRDRNLRFLRLWKEEDLSKELAQDEEVDGFSPKVAKWLGTHRRHGLYDLTHDRASFESLMGPHLDRWAENVAELLGKGAELDPPVEAVDVVLLTGGHSSWYWVKEMLAGSRSQALSGHPALALVRQEPVRILRGARPQETVGRGLAMMGAPLTVLRAAANDAWVTITIRDVQAANLAIQVRGDRLPTAAVGVCFDVPYDVSGLIGKSMPGSVTVTVGSSIDTGARFGPDAFAIPMATWVERWWERARQALGGTPKVDLILRVTVDQNEGVAVLGLIDTRVVGTVAYFVSGREEPGPDERDELIRLLVETRGVRKGKRALPDGVTIVAVAAEA